MPPIRNAYGILYPWNIYYPGCQRFYFQSGEASTARRNALFMWYIQSSILTDLWSQGAHIQNIARICVTVLGRFLLPRGTRNTSSTPATSQNRHYCKFFYFLKYLCDFHISIALRPEYQIRHHFYHFHGTHFHSFVVWRGCEGVYVWHGGGGGWVCYTYVVSNVYPRFAKANFVQAGAVIATVSAI